MNFSWMYYAWEIHRSGGGHLLHLSPWRSLSFGFEDVRDIFQSTRSLIKPSFPTSP